MPSETGVYRMSEKTWDWINCTYPLDMSHHLERWVDGYNQESLFNEFTPSHSPFDWFQSLVQRKAEELRESGDGHGLCQLEVDRMSCMIEDMRIAQENPGSFVPYPEMSVRPIYYESRSERDLIHETAAHMIRYSIGTATSNSNFYVVNPTV